MKKTNMKWRFRQGDRALQYILNCELSISPLLAGLLVNRGIYTVEEARLFLSGKLDDMHNPFLMKDMDRAVPRVVRALHNGEKIVIYGDYDVDGITSTAILVSVLRRLGGDVKYYIPNRLEEGYGLHAEVLEQLYEEGCRLLVTVDCGIGSVAEAALARKMGIDLIVTDHHEPPPILPEALAVVKPKRPDCTYPFKSLAGVGVALKFVQAFAEAAGGEPDMWKEYLDLACLGTVADIVPLKEENRILVKYGLEQLSRSTKPGLKALMSVSLGSASGSEAQSRESKAGSDEQCGIGEEVLSPHEVGFYLAPRLNAAGRVGNPLLGVELLLSDEEEEAFCMATELQRENQERQKLEAEALKEALEMLEDNKELVQSKVVVLASPNWHAGVIGIVASRLVDKFYRPVLLIALDGSEGKGSARSIPGFDMYRALKNCSEFLTGYGGHAQAAGFSIASDRVENFRKAINEYAEGVLDKTDFVPVLELDGIVSGEILTKQLAEELKLLAPFGHCNPAPLLVCRDVTILASREVGRGGSHLKMLLRAGKTVFDGIGFSLGKYSPLLAASRRVDVAFVPQINEWNGKRALQLEVKDFQYASAEGGEGGSFALPDAAGFVLTQGDRCAAREIERQQKRRETNLIEELFECSCTLLKKASPAVFLPEYISEQLQSIIAERTDKSRLFHWLACRQVSAGGGGEKIKNGHSTAKLEVLDKRNWVHRKEYAVHKIIESVAGNNKILILTNTPYRVVETAHCLKITCSKLKNENKEDGKKENCVLVYYHPFLNAAYKKEILSLFKKGITNVVVSTPAAADFLQELSGVQEVFAYHLPFSPKEWEITLKIASRRLHILFGNADEKINREKLDAFAPDRDCLAAFYVIMRRRVGNAGGTCTIAAEEVLKLLSQAGFSWARPCTVEIALAVFAELGFLSYQRVKNENFWVKMGPHPGGKVNLESSPTFSRVQKLKKQSLSWQQFLLNAPVEQLLDPGRLSNFDVG